MSSKRRRSSSSSAPHSSDWTSASRYIRMAACSELTTPPISSTAISERSDHVRARAACFLDASEAAAYLGGMNSRTVVKWAREGYLPAYPIGEGKRRLWRFRELDLALWMQSRRTGTLTAATDAPTEKGVFYEP